MYKADHALGTEDKNYLIEITITREDALVIVALNTINNEKDIIEIKPQLVKDVLAIFKNDYDLMAKCLRAQDNKVVLLNPNMIE